MGSFKSSLDTHVIREIFHQSYPHCGKLCEIKIQKFSNQTVNSSHFLVITDLGQFLLKSFPNAEEFYGTTANARLEIVSEVISYLSKNHLPIETIIQSKQNSYTLSIQNNLIRAYKFITGRPYSGTDEDIKSAATAQKEFHEKALNLLTPDLYKKISAVQTPIPLEQTLKKIDDIKKFVHSNSNCHFLVEDFKLIEETAERINCITSNYKNTLVHLDFHPANVLYSEDGNATMIDLDQMQIANPLKCVGLSILRFSNAQTFDHIFRLWCTTYDSTLLEPHKKKELLQWMQSIETEKILRILYRTLTTGTYEHYIQNIKNKHLPSLHMISKINI